MLTRRHFLTSIGSTLVAASSSSQADDDKAERPMLSFGLLADCQYVDAQPTGTRFYRESRSKLREAVQELNRHELAFTLHLGDFIDRDFASFEDLDPIAAELNSTWYHALGNHDFEVADDAKARVPGRLGLTSGYYSVRQAGFRFVVIDTTEVSVYRHPEGSAAHLAAAAELAKHQAAELSAAQPWNSRPGSAQLAWLERELKAATAADETVLLFGHHPILPNAGHSIWNAAAIDALLQRHERVKVYLNGHNHAGAYTVERGLHYLTLDGMVETKATNAFAYAHLFADRLEIIGFDRQESYRLEFR